MEAFAQALARGLPPGRAARESGYADTDHSHAKIRAKRPDMIARIAEIQREHAVALRDLTPLIERLTALADLAAQMDSPAALREARAALVEAGKLKALAPIPPRALLTGEEPELTDREWARRYGPRS